MLYSLILSFSLVTVFMAVSPASIAQDARALHDRVITFDAEIDIPFDFMEGGNNVGQETVMQVDLPKMDRGGLDGALFVNWVLQEGRTPSAYAKARSDAEQKFSAIEKMVQTYPDRIGLARTADEAEMLISEGKHFAVMGLVNAWPIGPDLTWLPELFDRGLRNITLTHAGHNQFADSSRPQERLNDGKQEHGGLSELGRSLVREMNDLGVIVDVSQVTPQAVFQTSELSSAPIIASHSGIKAIINTSRNLNDSEMVAIKNTGGTVGIVAFSSYLKASPPGKREALGKLTTEYGTTNLATITAALSPEKVAQFKIDFAAYGDAFPPATVADYVDSIAYAVNLLGIEHVTISSDMGHGGGIAGWMDAGEAPRVTEELVSRGYTEDQIAKLWWRNFARVWRAVEAVANES